MSKIRKGVVLFSAPPEDEFIKDAKEYISKYNLTNNEVKIIKSESGIKVVAKKIIMLGENYER